MKVDPRVYNAPEFDPIVGEQQDPSAQYVAPEPVSQREVLRNTEGAQLGAWANQEASRDKAGAFASLGAVMSEWSVRHAYDYFDGPTFEPDPEFSAGTVLPSLQTTLSETERNFLLESRSQAEFEYKQQAMERQREAAKAAGDSPFVSFLGAMLDPGYLAIDTLMVGTSRIARLANMGRAGERVVSGVTAAGGAYALGRVEQQAVPISDTEVILGALANGVATGMLYDLGTKRMRRVDEEYPTETLASIANKNPDIGLSPKLEFEAPDGMRKTGSDLVASLRQRYQGTEFQEILDKIAAAPELKKINVSTGDIAQSLQPKARGYWSRSNGQNLLFVRKNGEADVALHELTHAIVQPRLLADPAIKAELTTMQKNVAEALSRDGGDAAKFLNSQMGKNLNEFIAYAYTSPSFRRWAKEQRLGSTGVAMPTSSAAAPAPTNLWDKMVNWFSDALGVGRDKVKKMLDNGKANYKGIDPAVKSLDTRLAELLDDVNTGVEYDLYTKGVIKAESIDYSLEGIGKKVTTAANTEFDLGKKLSWSLHKTLGEFSPVAKEVADLLVDNPLDFTADSVVSQARAVRADLNTLQFQYEDLLKAELAKRGAGIKNRILKPRASLDAQKTLEREIAMEMLTRERNTRLGLTTTSRASKEVQQIADSLDKLYAAALKEMQAAGVSGAEEVAESSGYFSRKWDVSQIDASRQRLIDSGMAEAEAQNTLVKIVQQGIRRANGWDSQVSHDVAKAILDRAHRKGYFEDAAFRSHAGNEAAKEVRDILSSSGISGDRLQKAMDVITGVVDEAGVMSTLKKRVDIDMKSGVSLPDGTFLTVADLINTDITRATEAYLDQAAGRVAMARKGLPDVSDQDALRTRMLESIPSEGERAKAASLLDQTINSILGRPVGEDVPAMLRKAQAVTRMVGLASSGLWQVTEYSTAMARFGALKTLKYALKSADFSGLRAAVRKDRATSMQLQDVLTRNSAADIRIRPFIQRMEDNFDVPTSDIAQAALLQAQQLVPYLNAQKWVQSHQARMVANLATDALARAVKGDRKAIKMMEEYGLEPHILGSLKSDIGQFGMDTAKWSDDTWIAARGPLNKMMDDAVLRNRTGEIPAFAQFSQVGKFIFTFRSFVLGAHNKVLAGTISRDGLAGISLLMLYQFPLVLAATAANSTIQGKQIKDEKDWVFKSIGQMGSIGLFSELWGIATGEKQQFGAPGLIAIDRLYKVGGSVLSGDPGQALNGAIQATPILSIIPGTRAIGEALKE